MINYINGKLTDVMDNRIVVETGGVGFDMFFPASNIVNLPQIESNIKVYTYMNVKEDEISLFGFLTKEDKEMFLKLLTVNGVGPKGALNIISTFGFSELIKAISNEDSKLIASVQGIGKKTAEKICIELSDKMRKISFEGKFDIIKNNNEENKKLNSIKDEVIEALVKLGHKESKAREMISKIDFDANITASELLKLALTKY